MAIVELKKNQKDHCQTTQRKDAMHSNLEASMVIHHHAH